MNGYTSMISLSVPFVLSLSKDSEDYFRTLLENTSVATKERRR